jgi:Ca-activated chloride channel family protein
VISLDSLLLGEPAYAWLLVVPGLLLPVCVWQIARRRRDVRQFRHGRHLPAPGRMAFFGAWLFWLGVVLALGAATLALSRPQAAVAGAHTAGIDVIVLQDGSASMHVRDVSPDRWQRSMRFLRTLAESLRWKDDRIALALFARIAAPQVRLTRDPNTFFFFLDHLDKESPFPLKDDTTWDTNIERGIYWGTRLIDKDEAFNGRSPNGKVFVLVSDGQAWSGQVEKSLRMARSRDIPVFAVGVGTATGGFIPEAPVDPAIATGPPTLKFSTIHATLDRQSLLTIATAGGGQYFDLDRQTDRQVASTIIDAARRRAGSRGLETVFDELYWPCLFLAGLLCCLSVLFLRERAELWLHAIGASLALLATWTLTR